MFTLVRKSFSWQYWEKQNEEEENGKRYRTAGNRTSIKVPV
jgi:hypothetical protein